MAVTRLHSPGVRLLGDGTFNTGKRILADSVQTVNVGPSTARDSFGVIISGLLRCAWWVRFSFHGSCQGSPGKGAQPSMGTVWENANVDDFTGREHMLPLATAIVATTNSSTIKNGGFPTALPKTCCCWHRDDVGTERPDKYLFNGWCATLSRSFVGFGHFSGLGVCFGSSCAMRPKRRN